MRLLLGSLTWSLILGETWKYYAPLLGSFGSTCSENLTTDNVGLSPTLVLYFQSLVTGIPSSQFRPKNRGRG